MPNNSIKIFFLLTLISGVLISLSANSWMGAWMGLEINMLSFIPLISSPKNMFSSEASLKYFLIHAIDSSSLVFIILLKINVQEMFYFTFIKVYWNKFIIIPLLMKIASAPLHWWLPSVMEGFSWMNCMIILTIQKIAPLMLISYVLFNSYFSQMMIMTSVFIGAIGGFNQISLRKILSFSSINHIGWMLTTMILGSDLWITYFTIYMINIIIITFTAAMANMSNIMQTFSATNYKKMFKFTLFITILSLGGLPPLLGFFPKLITIQFMIQNTMIPLSMALFITSLLTLFFYLWIIYSTLMITNLETGWMTMLHSNYPSPKTIMISLWILLFGMLICTLILSIC